MRRFSNAIFRQQFQHHVIDSMAVSIRANARCTNLPRRDNHRRCGSRVLSGLHVPDAAQFGNHFVVSGDSKMVEPIEQSRPRFIEHPPREVRPERAALQTIVEQRLNQPRRLWLWRPRVRRQAGQ